MIVDGTLLPRGRRVVNQCALVDGYCRIMVVDEDPRAIVPLAPEAGLETLIARRALLVALRPKKQKILSVWFLPTHGEHKRAADPFLFSSTVMTALRSTRNAHHVSGSSAKGPRRLAAGSAVYRTSGHNQIRRLVRTIYQLALITDLGGKIDFGKCGCHRLLARRCLTPRTKPVQEALRAWEDTDGSGQAYLLSALAISKDKLTLPAASGEQTGD